MSGSRPITRRRLTGLLASLAASIASRALGGETDSQTPIDSDPKQVKDKRIRDRGIGGTGVIGTIRGFGSIIVNNLRISYPEGVSVAIDGRRTTAAALRIGHVVQAVAHQSGKQVVTSHIEVTSEVVGPVQFVKWPMMTVLGQAVLADGPASDLNIRKGDMVAVSGLRRLDGTIIASRVERRRGSRVQVAGPVAVDTSGVPYIGQLAARGIHPALVGVRAVLTGRLVKGALQIKSARKDLAMLDDTDLPRLLIETYASSSTAGAMFGFGFRIPFADLDARIPGNGEVLVIAEMRRSAEGHLNLGSVTSEPGGRPMSGTPGGPPPTPGVPGGRPGIPGGMQAPDGPKNAPPSGGGGGGPPGGPSNLKGPPSRP